MKSIKLLAVILAVLGLTSCGNYVLKNFTKQLPPLDDSAEVIVYDRNDTVPKHSEIIGGILYTRVVWDTVFEAAKKEARVAGGNGLEVQFQGALNNPYGNAQVISAFILNVNDSITPAEPATFKKLDFNDYIVTKEGDTIRGTIVGESKKIITIVHGYNRLGYRKTIESRKKDLLTYHIEDPSALSEANLKWNNKSKELFTAQIAVDGGYSVTQGSFPVEFSYYIAANVRFRNKIHQPFNYLDAYQAIRYRTLGLLYVYLPPAQYNFIAGSIGRLMIMPRVQQKQVLDSYLGGAPDYPKFKKPGSIFYGDVLLGYIYYDHIYYDEYDEPWGTIRSHSVGLGGDIGRDYLLTEHFALGWMLNGVLGIPLKNSDWSWVASITAGLRYYW